MATDARVTTLEHAMADLAIAQARSVAGLDRFTDEMSTFKDELRAFKDEMRVFKDEMRAFRDESRAASREMDRRWGELANKMGTLTEDIVAPGIPRVFKDVFGLAEVDSFAVRVKRRHRADRGRSREFDALAAAGDLFLVHETKSQLRSEDVTAFVALLGEVRDFLPETKGQRVVGSLASFIVDKSVVAFAQRPGLLVFGLGSGLLELLTPPGFEPRVF